jgi:heterotetrameric sarcosine oxidase gamma subunit
MRESSNAMNIEFSPLSRAATLRLVSFAPRCTADAAPVTLGDDTLPAHVGDTLPGEVRALCIAPREWLLVADKISALDIQKHLQAELAAQDLALADLSDGLVVFDIAGANARALLAKGSGVDFDLLRFPVGHCARTRFAQVPVVVECVAPERFELTVGRSYRYYLELWLQDAITEFQS